MGKFRCWHCWRKVGLVLLKHRRGLDADLEQV